MPHAAGTASRRSLRARRRRLALCLLAWGGAGVGCASLALPGRSVPEPAAAVRAQEHQEREIYRSAHRERARYLEREVERLKADLRQAEESMVAIESGLRSAHGRADAVSAVAEARLSVGRARQRSPWRRDQLSEAAEKLEEAERQLQADRPGSAVFFASRAQRIADTLHEEADRVEAAEEDVRIVGALRVNLRSGPSTEHEIILILDRDTPVFAKREQGSWVMVRTLVGPVGWVHASLLATR